MHTKPLDLKIHSYVCQELITQSLLEISNSQLHPPSLRLNKGHLGWCTYKKLGVYYLIVYSNLVEVNECRSEFEKW